MKKQTIKERWREHNKWRKRTRQPKITFEEYQSYITGKGRYTPKELPTLTPKPYYRETAEIPSAGTGVGAPAATNEPKVYTGTLIKGVATMHKSNAVPVINDEQAIDISRMRRG